MEVRGLEEYSLRLEQYGNDMPAIAQRALMAGANIIADEVRNRLENLPEDAFRKLKEDEKFSGVPEAQKKDLLNSLGISPVGVDSKGNTNLKVGFDGYGSHETRMYPNGLPNQLLARAVESGSSVRKKTPFVRPTVNAKKKEAIAAIGNEINISTKI